MTSSSLRARHAWPDQHTRGCNAITRDMPLVTSFRKATGAPRFTNQSPFGRSGFGPSERCSNWHCYCISLTKTLWPKCHIQWLYLATHGCKTYLSLNLNQPTHPRKASDRGDTQAGHSGIRGHHSVTSLAITIGNHHQPAVRLPAPSTQHSLAEPESNTALTRRSDGPPYRGGTLKLRLYYTQ
jgi:hypothetical protein